MNFITPEFSAHSFLFLQHSNVKFGTTTDGKWISTIKDQTNKITPPDNILSLLPILELDRDFVHEKILQIQSTNHRIPHIDTSFPELDILKAAIISSVSEYWPEKALNWIESDPNLASALRESVELLAQKEWAPQKLKHRCKKILRSICI